MNTRKLNRKLLAYALAPMLGLGLLGGASVVSAHGFGLGGSSNITPEQVAVAHQTMFEKQAALLGLNVEIIKAGWAEGKSLKEIAEANGISLETLRAKMQEQRKAEMKAEIQALVSKGIITQAQADQRIKVIEERMASGEGKGKGKGRGIGLGIWKHFDL